MPTALRLPEDSRPSIMDASMQRRSARERLRDLRRLNHKFPIVCQYVKARIILVQPLYGARHFDDITIGPPRHGRFPRR